MTRGVDGSLNRVRQHWLLVANALFAVLVAVALLVPVLYALDVQPLASQIFDAYHFICAQIPAHSYYILGYQVALCARNLAIYGSLLTGMLLFRYIRSWLPQPDFILWGLTMVPMAWDGGTQLFGWRESNWEVRTLTGALFGLGVCWFLLPRFEDALSDALPLRRIRCDLRVLDLLQAIGTRRARSAAKPCS